MRSFFQKSGFTLIELCIVFLVVGLLVGGILVGGELIRTAEINRIFTETEKYKSAMKTFELKYDSQPGDMADASTYFTETRYGGDNTLNGNGNGLIDLNERYELWHHLSLATMIPDAIPGCPTCDATLPQNAWSGAHHGNETPGIMVPGTASTSYRFTCTQGYGTWSAANPPYLMYTKEGCSLLIAAGGSGAGMAPNSGILTRTEAAAFDTKYDDGKASDGKLIGWPGGYTGCGANENCSCTDVYDGSNTANANYAPDATGRHCGIHFLINN